MPRNRPGALRGARPAPGPRFWKEPPPARIPGLSARTSLAIHRAERLSPGFWFSRGATETALRRYRAFLHPPGNRPRYPRESYCPSCPGCALDDVRQARDALADILPLLPPRARAELRRAVTPLDRRYLRLTLPDPLAGPAAPWWHRRLAKGVEGW
ncbi:hypothetical protein [Streptomyces diastatochromogenes]|uniref:Uncharacterized protein n=1 Tax=Streptomyces diastatochromogenes TaxID=42236 RepID=A0A233SEH9_STRDA|nr:hypothetical protein [Streptomyces diastatochromogenes]OXY94050.1 hypothetical protein BEK98_19370 [Streptomyces diastatochromogenes]